MKSLDLTLFYIGGHFHQTYHHHVPTQTNLSVNNFIGFHLTLSLIAFVMALIEMKYPNRCVLDKHLFHPLE